MSNELFEQFVQHGLYLKGWSPKTPDVYRRAFTNFQQSQRHTPEFTSSTGEASSSSPAVLTKAQLEAWVIWMRQRGLTATCINIYIRSMNSFLTWLKEHEHVAQHLKLRQVPNPTKPLRGVSDAEVRAVLALHPKRFGRVRAWTLINTLLDTGIRINEALTLRTAEVDLDNTCFKVLGKGNKVRLVPFSIELRKILFTYLQTKTKRRINNTLVFCAANGSALRHRNIYRDIKNLFKQAGVEGEHIHPHALRHCFAVTYIRRGGDIYRLSRILGHSSISTTQIYLRSMGIEQIAENHSSLSPLARI